VQVGRGHLTIVVRPRQSPPVAVWLPAWLPGGVSSTRTSSMFDPRRTDDEFRGWANRILLAGAACVGVASAVVRAWLTAVAMVLVVVGAAVQIYRRRSATAPEV